VVPVHVRGDDLDGSLPRVHELGVDAGRLKTANSDHAARIGHEELHVMAPPGQPVGDHADTGRNIPGERSGGVVVNQPLLEDRRDPGKVGLHRGSNGWQHLHVLDESMPNGAGRGSGGDRRARW